MIVRVAADGGIVVHCFGCGAGGDALALVAAARELDGRRDFRRVLAEAADLAHVSFVSRPFTPPRTPPKICASELATLWSACGAVYDDGKLAASLRRRGLDPADVTDRDLARALPTGRTLPRWARFERKSWAEHGNRLTLPMYDAAGRLTSLHARYLGADQRALPPKGLSPLGGRIAGTIMADALGRLLLQTASAPAWWTERVISSRLLDGSDALRRRRECARGARPARRLVDARDRGAHPRRLRVVIRTHTDVAGAKYAAAIGSSLAGRCEVFRPEVTR